MRTVKYSTALLVYPTCLKILRYGNITFSVEVFEYVEKKYLEKIARTTYKN